MKISLTKCTQSYTITNILWIITKSLCNYSHAN